MTMDPLLVKAVGTSGIRRQLSAGSAIYRQGEVCHSYFLVISGWIVQSAVTQEGAVQILDFAIPGTLLGLAPKTEAMHHTAHSLTSVVIRCYSRSWLHERMNDDPQIGRILFDAACASESRAHCRLLQLGLGNARERVVQLLMELYVRINGRTPDRAGETMELPLTQRHIALATGLTGEHVNRTLRYLHEQGVLRFNKRRLHILDPHALWQNAGMG